MVLWSGSDELLEFRFSADFPINDFLCLLFPRGDDVVSAAIGLTMKLHSGLVRGFHSRGKARKWYLQPTAEDS